MPPITPRHRHAASFKRLADRRFLRRRIGPPTTPPSPVPSSESDPEAAAASDADVSDSRCGDDLFGTGRERRDDEEEHFGVRQLSALRKVNSRLLYLVKWNVDGSLSSESETNIDWRLTLAFEAAFAEAKWYQTTRGSKRPRTSRSSSRLRGKLALSYCL
jgi:hypothetical protein